jgi:hypothetical protein
MRCTQQLAPSISSSRRVKRKKMEARRLKRGRQQKRTDHD